MGRRSVWSDAKVRELLPRFIPVADEVYRLQTGDDPDCRLFQKIAEQGHYAGRSRPSGTRQGTYAAAPNGMLLASINSTDPERIAEMLQRALTIWEILPRKGGTPSSGQRRPLRGNPTRLGGTPSSGQRRPLRENPTRLARLLSEDPQSAAAGLRRAERRYPEDGLVLQIYSRDLPREQPVIDRWANAWNQDFAWFTKAEALQFLPERPAIGQKHDVPEALIRRLARCHLLDNVRGQTRPFDDTEVEKAGLTVEVLDVEDRIVTVRLAGETRAAAAGVWSIRGFRDMDEPTPQQRGVETCLLGNAKYDLQEERFTAFELLALGTRWGATQYNVRGDDRDPAPIGFAFTLTAGDHPAGRVAPAHLRAYGW